MNKPPLSAATSANGAQSVARPRADALLKKKLLPGEEELAQGNVLPSGGVELAAAGQANAGGALGATDAAGGVGGGAATGTGSGAAAGASGAAGVGAGAGGVAAAGGGAAVAGAAAGSWLASGWALVGLGAGAIGIGSGVSRSNQPPENAAPLGPRAPVAPGGAFSGTEDAASVTGRLPASDANGDALTFSVVGATPAGVTVNANGTFSVTPQAADQALDAGESRVITFQYVANDGKLDSAPATVTITINGVNDAPVTGGAASASGSENAASITGNVPVATDVDVEPLTYSVVGTPPAGLTFNANGTFSYVPQAADQALDVGESRAITFQYVANDGTVNSAPATVTITVSGANDAPVSGGNVSLSGTEDAASITGNVPAATDVDVEALTYALTAAAPAGVTFNSNGSFSVAPQLADQALDVGESRVVTFQYVANDGTANSAPATVTVTINGANDAPVTGGAASASGSEDAASITGSVPAASDVDGEALTYALTAAAPAGLTFNSNGTFSYVPQAADNALDAGETRTVTFQYVANDGTANSAPATVTITINGANDAPVTGGAGSASGSEDAASITGSVPVATDVDVETLTYTAVGVTPAGLTLNPNGTFSYVPQAADNALDAGETRTVTFQYVANDGTANSAPATVTITINGANDAPVTGGAGSASGSEDAASITGSVPVATDVDGETLTYAVVGTPPVGVIFNSNGSFSVAPQAADQALDIGESRVITFQYVANDGTANSAPATVTVTINGVNDAPVAAAASFSVTEDAASITGTVAATDVDGEALSYALSGVNPPTLIFNSDGTFSYPTLASDQLLDDGESRVVSFQYVANDGTANSAPATVTLTINGANDAPVSGGNVSVSGTEDMPTLTSSVPAAFDIDGEALTYTLTAAAPAGVTFNSNGTFSYVPQAADNALDAGETRTVTFQYVANDGTANSAPATVTITIYGANDAPVSGGDGTASGSKLANINGSLPTATDVDDETLTYTVVGVTPAGLTLNPNGTFTYVPQPDDLALLPGQSRTVSFDYDVRDEGFITAPATMTLTISGGSAPVTGGNASVSGSEDAASITGNVPAASDADGEPITYHVVGATPAGLTFNSNGTFSYVPQAADQAPDTGETRTVTFNYAANDGSADSATATVTITINGANDAPVAVAGSASGSEDAASITGSVTATDVDVEALTYALTAAAPAGLTFNSNGTFSYVPQAADNALDAGETRTVSFQYVANDGTVNSAPATVTITINGANDAPVTGGAASASGSEDAASIAGSVPVATDVDGEALTYVVVGTPPAGLTLNPNGTFSYVPQPADNALDTGETRTVTFQYVANDGSANSAPATVTITVSGANDAPVTGGAASASGSEDAATITGSVPAATDVDGEALTYALTAAAPAGLTFNPNGTFSYVPQSYHQSLAAGQWQDVVFQYQATDGTVTSAPATVTIRVNGANDAPVATNQTFNFLQDGGQQSNQLSAYDPDYSNPLSYNVTSGTAHGLLQITSGGQVLYTPDAGYIGSDSFSYSVTDGIETRFATVTLYVAPPITEGPDYIYGTDGPDTIDALGGDDVIDGQLGNDTLSGGKGSDTIYGSNGNDTLAGGSGNDTLFGGADDDTLTGGSGDDNLNGGLGADTYVFNRGDGQDHIYDEGGSIDVLQFGPGIKLSDVIFSQNFGSHLEIRLNNAFQDSVRIIDYFTPGSEIEQIKFSDGTILTPVQVTALAATQGNSATEGADNLVSWSGGGYVNGLGGNDTIRGLDGDDNLQGGNGADTLYGGAGDDQLVGFVWVETAPGSGVWVEQDDGANDILFGGSGDDDLQGGAGNDTLTGGTGSDELEGGAGNDTYIFRFGDGRDFISQDANEGLNVPGTDTIRLEGVNRAQAEIAREGMNLVISLRDGAGGFTGDSITVWGHFYNEAAGGYGYGNFAISQLQFDDSIVSNFSTLDRQTGTIIYGNSSANTLTSSTSVGDAIFGGAGNDNLTGGTGADFLFGGAGNDTFLGGAGDDELSDADANGGNDTYIYRYGIDGTDFIEETREDENPGDSDTLKIYNALGGIDFGRDWEGLFVQVGNDGDGVYIDRFFRHDNDPITFADIWSLEADVETIQVYSDAGTNLMWQITSIDLLRHYFGSADATDSSDLLLGTSAADLLGGGDGNDNLQGGHGADTLYGGEGNDTLHGYGFDALGNPLDDNANDKLHGWYGDDQLFGGGGSDELYGHWGDDYLEGGAGNDILRGGAGDDELEGGLGNDTYVFTYGDGNDFVDQGTDTGAPGTDTLLLQGVVRSRAELVREGGDLVVYLRDAGGVRTGDSITIRGHFYDEATANYGWGSMAISNIQFADQTLTGTAAINAAINSTSGTIIYGTAGNDTLTASTALGDFLLGVDGNDTLTGGAGNDLLFGGAGNDIHDGRAGNDEFDEEGGGSDTYIYRYGTDGTDRIFEASTSDDPTGSDTLRIYNVPASRAIGFVVQGNGLLVNMGPRGDEGIYIEDFFDGSGNPNATIENILLFSDAGTTQVASYTLAQVLAQINGSGSATSGADNLNGTAGADLLSGGAGDDTLMGFNGSDSLHGGAGNDQLFGFGFSGGAPVDDNAADFLSGGSGNDRLEGGGGNDVLLGGDGTDELRGGAGNDTLYGGLGDGDRLHGDGGDDILSGGAGDFDEMQGGAGNDTYLFGFGYGRDSIDQSADSAGANVPGSDTLRLTGVNRAQAEIAREGADLVITLRDAQGNATGDEVRVNFHFYNEAATGFGYGSFAITNLQFDDQTLSGAAINSAVTRTEGALVFGTAGNDTVVAVTAAGDILLGGAGNDTLTGGAGDDDLIGGTGNDTYRGGLGDDLIDDFEGGSDTYLYHYNRDGRDSISETQADEDLTGVDILKILNAPASDALVSFNLQGGGDLWIQIGDDPAQGVLVQDFFAFDGSGALNADVEQIIIYSDNGVTQLDSYTSQEIQHHFFG